MQNCNYMNCRYRENFYTKSGITFHRHYVYYCLEFQKLIQGKDCGERWEKRPQKKGHNSRKNCAITAITKISYNLSVIARILEDDYKEAEEEEDW